MSIVYKYFAILDVPLHAVARMGLEVNDTVLWLYRIIATLILLGLVSSILRSTRRYVRGMFRSRALVDQDEYAVLMSRKGMEAPAAHVGPSAPSRAEAEVGIEVFKRSKQYDKLGEIYSSLNQPKTAARYYKKARMRRHAAVELAKAGKTLQAARLLMKEGDFEGAGQLYDEKGKYAKAAAAFERAGNRARAAMAHQKAGKLELAAQTYADYFSSARDTMEIQFPAAQECLKLLESDLGRRRIVGDVRNELIKSLAPRFEAAKWYELAAKLHMQAGDVIRAGEDFVLAGKLEEAAQCMKAAGKSKEALQIMGRFHETKGNWREAAAAYASAGEYARAGECYSNASDAVHAGECFERAGEFYRSGMAYARGARFAEAIRVLQKVKESHPTFDSSRALLGRCFYEQHDYAHAAATLDNHLLGKRVETGNVDYFYMLARAYEQMGKLEESREILYKIRTVDVNFKDVTQLLSNISSRISMQASIPQSLTTPVHTSTPASVEATQVMQTVEHALDGRYRLQKELGRGGMGVVYLAKDAQLERSVALKFLGSLVDSSEEFRERFIREARAAAKISHPNIISIYDISASSGKAYIAMEYVDGPSLARYIREKGALSPREAVNIVAQACSALGAIHEAGIVHRDIKPDNILIAKGLLVKLTDFGLAKADDARLTRAGTVLGTPSYMSPEQVLGKEADRRSDLYSLGLVLHEALTGKTVFRDGDVMERQVTETPLPPSALVDGITNRLDEIVMKCIAKKPEERYQQASELYADLRKALS